MTQENNDAVMVLPVLPLKNTVLFPHLFMPLSVGRPQSVAAVEAALATEEKTFVVVAQRDASVEQPRLDDLYTVGTRAVIKKMARGEGGIEMHRPGPGARGRSRAPEQTEPYLKARVRPLPLPGRQRHGGRGAAPRRARAGRRGPGAGPAADADQHPAARGPGRRPAAAGLPARLDAQPGRGQGAGAARSADARWRRCGCCTAT